MKKHLYRIVRFIGRYFSFTPEYIQNISPEIFVASARKYEGYSYVLWADGSSKKGGIDCSRLIARALIDANAMNPYFYRTAQYLTKLITPVSNVSQVSLGNLLFLWDETGRIGHVAIVLYHISGTHFRIFDASWSSTWVYSTLERDIDVSWQKYLIGSLFCIS